MHAPTWFILGAGSIGCLFAANLRRAGHPVTLILRTENDVAEFRRSGGIQLNSLDGATYTVSCDAIALETLARGPSSQISRVLVCTKAHQTRDAVQALLPALVETPQLVLLQNGMGVRELIQPLLPGAAITQAITTEGAWRRARFDVVHAGRGETLLGANHRPALAQTLAAALRCELAVRVDAAFEERLWLKLAVNCVINPLTALRECRNGDLLHQPDVPAQVRALCAELGAVAAACGQNLPIPRLEAAVFEVMERTADNQSSMWQDLQHRRRTEIDFINGYVVRQGERHDLRCPAHAALQQAIKNKEAALNCV